MHTVYILKSNVKDWYYIGHTNNLTRRIQEHNNKQTKSTRAYAPFQLVLREDFDTKSGAYRREIQIKKYRHGEAFKNLINRSGIV